MAAVQVNVLVNTMLSASQPGAPTWLNFAFRLMYLPMGLFGVSEILVNVERAVVTTLVTEKVKGLLPNRQDWKESFWRCRAWGNPACINALSPI